MGENEKIIGIVGGVGPYASIDLLTKIFDQTKSTKDQDHLPVVMLSMPGHISDRTGFLLGKEEENPGIAISRIILSLRNMGANVVGIPCNTTHTPQIYNVILDELQKNDCNIKLIHIVNEVIVYIKETFPLIKKVGVLSTTGTYKLGIYRDAILKAGLNFVPYSTEEQQDVVNRAIYDTEYGIKSKSNPITEKAKADIHESIGDLSNNGAQAVILGCTELCMAVTERSLHKCIIIDSNKVLARALINEVNPEKLLCE